LALPSAQVVNLQPYVDDRGAVTELLRSDDEHFSQFGQVYKVESFARGTVRAWHKHGKMWDWFHIARGAAKFGFTDGEGDPQPIVACESTPILICVPPGLWHGWVALEDRTLLISIASEPYKGHKRQGELDETRVPWDHWGRGFWEVHFK
jgi:dTDP-4-dehydrorhamnose 3,5-epimerase